MYARERGRYPSYHKLVDAFHAVCVKLADKYDQYAFLRNIKQAQIRGEVDWLVDTSALFRDHTRGSTVRIDHDIADFRGLRRCQDRYLISKVDNLSTAQRNSVINELCWPVESVLVQSKCEKMKLVLDDVHCIVKQLALNEKEFEFLR